MSYQAESYQQSAGGDALEAEQERLVEEYRERRKNKTWSRLRLLCASVVVFFVVAAVYVVVKTAIRTRDIRHHQVIASHQIDSLNAKKTAAPFGCESTVVLMRHCEKDGPNTTDAAGNRHCSAVGMERAEFLPTLFGEGGRWPNPTELYALSINRPGVKHLNYREFETLEPLSEEVNVDIDAKFTVGHEPYLADHIFLKLASGDLCDQVTVISWKHTHIPAMSSSLGCGRKEGCPAFYPPKDFEQMWIIHYVYGPDDNEQSATRNLKKKKGTWTVKGTVVQQGFDPRNPGKRRKNGSRSRESGKE